MIFQLPLFPKEQWELFLPLLPVTYLEYLDLEQIILNMSPQLYSMIVFNDICNNHENNYSFDLFLIYYV